MMSTIRPQLRESLRDLVLRLSRPTPRFARRMALAALLVIAALVFGPKIKLLQQSNSGSAWAAAIQSRATVDFEDDFQSGFKNWIGKPGWESTWALDGTASAQPGRLALYRDTIPLTDYRLEFNGQILSKALGFVVRAADTNNYQAVKIV